MIEKVWSIWIGGILQASLPDDLMLELGLTERPAMVTRPLDVYIQPSDRTDRAPAPGARLIDIFDRLDRALLILGAPGAGKTTQLLILARDLLQRAAGDSEHPIPVVFPLSSWAERQPSLSEWLVEALSEQYGVPLKLGQAWVEADQILPLLDGLDEVAQKDRAACAEAINAFRQEHGLLPLVVCSRLTDYEVLGVPLQLQGALVVRPLTYEQVDGYFEKVGQPLAAAREVLRDDPALRELLDTPLALTIMTVAYAGECVEMMRARGSLVERREHLFAAYVNRMFQRRTAAGSYPREQAERWLVWLARQMKRHKQTVFYLERMQPDWLPDDQQIIPGAVLALLVGAVGGLFFGLPAWYIGGLGIGLAAGLFGAVLQGTITLFFAMVGEIPITSVESLRWSWSAMRPVVLLIFIGRLAWGLVIGLGFGLLIGLFTSLVSGVSVGLSAGLIAALGIGLSIGGPAALLEVVKQGLSGAEIDTKTFPNQGIRRSARNALLVGVATGVVGGTGIGLAAAQLVSGSSALFIALVSTFFLGVQSGLLYGGASCVQHYTLRRLLVRNGSAPWRYVDFLDDAAERILLRKVGGGYIFTHRLLQDYFASLGGRRAARRPARSAEQQLDVKGLTGVDQITG